MKNLTIQEIFIRLTLTILFSGIIGYEREKNNSTAGLKTHMLVSMGSAIVALIQVETIMFGLTLSSETKVSVDAVRLIAQVVSGIGFLGAGTIIITKRQVVGLTTASSIWGASSLGLAFGMGYYDIAIISSILMLAVLIIFKRLIVIHGPQQVLIKFINHKNLKERITGTMSELYPDYEIYRLSSEPLDDHIVTTMVFQVIHKDGININLIAKTLSNIEDILTIEMTHLG